MINGIICEYNPFHKGHKYMIDKIKGENDSVVCVMSGNFVQRGEFAVYEKYARAKTALTHGADLIIELPCAYSLRSAEGFARAGVEILEATSTVERIAFGTECDDIDELYSLAGEIKSHNEEIKEEMKKGLSYPAARKNVLKSNLLDTPNNILALEYINASSLPCVSVKRVGGGHDSGDINYSSSAIRESLPLSQISSIKNCERALLAKLRTMTADDFLKIEDVSDGLENRIVEAVRSSVSIEEIYDKIKTKRYTYSRIKRIILKAYLSITEEYTKSVPYLRILGFNEKGREILFEMKKNASLPIISRFGDIGSLDEYGRRLFELECRCTDLYNLGFKNPLPCGTEHRSKVIALKD